MSKARNLSKLLATETGAIDNLTDSSIVTTKLANASVTSDKLAANAAKLNLGLTTWNVTEVSGVLYFSVNGVNKAKLDTSGNLTVIGNITAYGTV